MRTSERSKKQDMQSLVQSFSKPAPYRIVSIVLLIAAFGIPAITDALGAPDWLGFLLGLPPYVLLIVITHHRLRDAATSSGWIILMILTFNVGPVWQGYHLGVLVNLAPVIFGWIARSAVGVNSQPA